MGTRDLFMRSLPYKPRKVQLGVSAIEFALVAVILFTLLFGIIEFGRLLFTINSVQEITRRAAREQVVRWVTAKDTVQRMAVLRPGSSGTVNFPGSPDITNAYVQLRFYNTYPDAVAGGTGITTLSNPEENFANCVSGVGDCIRFVRATLSQDPNGQVPLDFKVLAAYMPAGLFPLPVSTVIMPAEALGLL